MRKIVLHAEKGIADPKKYYIRVRIRLSVYLSANLKTRPKLF